MAPTRSTPPTRDEPGTTITLHLKSTDEEDGISPTTPRIRGRCASIVKQYSDFVSYPIQTDVERGSPRSARRRQIEDKYVKSIQRETLNSMKAIWLRDKNVGDGGGLQRILQAHRPRLAAIRSLRIQAKIEGTLEYSMLLYIRPAADGSLHAPGSRSHGVQLYVQRVFIMEDCKELLPEYLRFVRGVVDSEDLSLNVSREMLQQDRQIAAHAQGHRRARCSASLKRHERQGRRRSTSRSGSSSAAC
jgi:molecular chaperone HtpG